MAGIEWSEATAARIHASGSKLNLRYLVTLVSVLNLRCRPKIHIFPTLFGQIMCGSGWKLKGAESIAAPKRLSATRNFSTRLTSRRHTVVCESTSRCQCHTGVSCSLSKMSSSRLQTDMFGGRMSMAQDKDEPDIQEAARLGALTRSVQGVLKTGEIAGLERCVNLWHLRATSLLTSVQFKRHFEARSKQDL